MTFDIRRMVLVLCAALAVAVGAGASAEPIRAAASRKDIDRWFAARAHIDFSRQQHWGFSFFAADGRELEALSVALVREGYAIAALEGGSASKLIVVKTELNSPGSIEERGRSLGELARRHGARYVGCDLVF
jgi:hypothetical protein